MMSSGRRSVDRDDTASGHHSALGDKYNQLVEHYKKLRAENAVLKSAIVAEQDKVHLGETATKEKEVALRASVEENDMLTFNNQRLTKRVEQLMLQLQEQKNESRGGWGGFFTGSKTEITRLNEELGVCKEQLSSKLEENETLVSQMFQLRSEHEQTVAMLDKKLTEFKKLDKEKEDDISQNSQRHDGLIADLNEEKNAINMKVMLHEKELESTRAWANERETTLTTINRQLSTDLERTQRLYDHKVAFDDTRVSEYNKMNCPGFDRLQMVRKIEIAEGFFALFDTLTQAYQTHDASLRDRLTLMGRNLSAMSKLQRVNEKITELLPEHQTHLVALRESCRTAVLSMKATLDIKLQQQLGDTVSKNPSHSVARLFKRLVLYHNKLLPYELLSLMEEARKDTCVPVLQARNYVLVSTQKRFVAALDKLAVYVQLACCAAYTRSQEANAPTILKYAASSMASVHQAFQAYASHLISKISQEHRAPFVLPELKAVNEKVLNSLSILTATTGKMVELMNDYTGTHSSAGALSTVRGVECDPLQMSEDLPRMQSRARHFFSNVLTRDWDQSLRKKGGDDEAVAADAVPVSGGSTPAASPALSPQDGHHVAAEYDGEAVTAQEHRAKSQ